MYDKTIIKILIASLYDNFVLILCDQLQHSITLN